MTEETLIVFFTTRYQHAQKKNPRKKNPKFFFSSPLFSSTPEDQAKLSRRPSSSQAARPS
jgi:hypothetical protein